MQNARKQSLLVTLRNALHFRRKDRAKIEKHEDPSFEPPAIAQPVIPAYVHQHDGQDHISAIPSELIFYLLDFLIYPDILSLRLTSHHLHSLVPTADFPRHHRGTAPVIFSQELTALYDQRSDGPRTYPGLPCYNCYLWLDHSHFTNGRSQGAFALGQWSATERLCMQCGVCTGLYRKGQKVGRFDAVCLDCGKLYPGGCRFPLQGYDRFCRVCAPTKQVHAKKCQDHERQKRLATYLKYLDGMEQGKLYRLRKGEQLSMERGIQTVACKTSNVGPLDSQGAGMLVPWLRPGDGGVSAEIASKTGTYRQYTPGLVPEDYLACLVRVDQRTERAGYSR